MRGGRRAKKNRWTGKRKSGPRGHAWQVGVGCPASTTVHWKKKEKVEWKKRRGGKKWGTSLSIETGRLKSGRNYRVWQGAARFEGPCGPCPSLGRFHGRIPHRELPQKKTYKWKWSRHDSFCKIRLLASKRTRTYAPKRVILISMLSQRVTFKYLSIRIKKRNLKHQVTVNYFVNFIISILFLFYTTQNCSEFVFYHWFCLFSLLIY